MTKISSFVGLEPDRILANDGLVDDELYQEQIQPYIQEYLSDFPIDVSDFSDEELASLSFSEFRSLLDERWDPGTVFERSTLGSFERANAFIEGSKNKSSGSAKLNELPPPSVTLQWPPIHDSSDQVAKLKEMVFPVLDLAVAGLEKLITPQNFSPFSNAEGTSLRPLTLNLFALSLAPFISSGSSLVSGEFAKTSDYFTSALGSLAPGQNDYIGGRLATTFGHVRIGDAETRQMRPLSGLDVLQSGFDLSQALSENFNAENLSLFHLPSQLIELATNLLTAHPEILSELSGFEKTEAYQDLLQQTQSMKQNILDYKAELDELDGDNSLDTNRFIALIPNPEAQTALLANLGIDPRMEPYGEKPSWMGEDCWIASQNYALGQQDLSRQEMLKSVASVAVMAFLGVMAGSNPFGAAALATLAGTAFPAWDIYSEKKAQNRAEAGRLASEAMFAGADEVEVSGTPDLATDRDVARAEDRVQAAVEKAPVDIAINAIGMGIGAGTGAAARTLLSQGSRTAAVGLMATDFGAQTFLGTTSAFVDDRNWTTDENGEWEISAEALLTATAMGAFGAGLGHVSSTGPFDVPPNTLEAAPISVDTPAPAAETPFRVTDASTTNSSAAVHPSVNYLKFKTVAEAKTWAAEQTSASGYEYSYMRDGNGYAVVKRTGPGANSYAEAPTDILGGTDGPEINRWFGAELIGHTHDGTPIPSFRDIDNVAAQAAIGDSAFGASLETTGQLPSGESHTLTLGVEKIGNKVKIKIEGDAPLRELATSDPNVARDIDALDGNIRKAEGEINSLLERARRGDQEAVAKLRTRAGNALNAPSATIPKETLLGLKQRPGEKLPLKNPDNQVVANIYYDDSRRQFFIEGSAVIMRGEEMLALTNRSIPLSDGDKIVLGTERGMKILKFEDP